MRTSGLVAGRHLTAGHRHDRHVTAYYAVAPSVFQGIIVRWRRCRPVAPIDAYTFVDLGAGMGRAMLLASAYPFRAVVGVEMHPTLARIGRRNMALWRAAGRTRVPMRMHCRDAVGIPSSCGSVRSVPFQPIWQLRYCGACCAPGARPLPTARANSIFCTSTTNRRSVLRREPGFTRLFHGPIRRSQADAVADRTILKRQPGAEYAATLWEDCSIYRWAPKAGSRDREPSQRGQPQAASDF